MNSIYEWPEYYDWTSPGLDRDVTYYVELAKERGGPVLELGCGTGRITLAIVQAGISVVGVDKSETMIQHARQKAAEMGVNDRVSWQVMDMHALDVSGSFPLVIIPYRAFLHLLTIREQIATLKRIRQLLTDDGILVFDVLVPRMDQLMDMNEKLAYRGMYPVPGKKETVEIYDFTECEADDQLVYVIRYYERFDERGYSLERLRTAFQFRYSYPVELNHLLTLCGFKVLARYGTFHRKPFDRLSDELIIEATKRMGIER